MNFLSVYLLLLTLLFIFIIISCQNIQIETFSNSKDPYDIVYTKLYDKTFNYSLLYKYDIEKIERECIKKKKNIKILDAGCGVGKHYQYLYKKYKTIGVDKSENMLKQARIRNPTGNFINDDLINEKMFKSQSFSHILCLSDALYHNNPEGDMKTVLENFYYWLKDGGYLCVHIFNRDEMDPGPREFSQYYTDKKGRRHSITYFNKYTHDAYWINSEKDHVKYDEQFLLADGRKKTKVTKLYIPKDRKKIIGKIEYYGFKLDNIIDLKKLYVDDIELYIFKKIRFNNIDNL